MDWLNDIPISFQLSSLSTLEAEETTGSKVSHVLHAWGFVLDDPCQHHAIFTMIKLFHSLSVKDDPVKLKRNRLTDLFLFPPVRIN